MFGADRPETIPQRTRGEPPGKPGRGQDGASGGDAGNAQPSLPAISLPKGGGAIRGMGEKFSANPVTGTGSLNVPVYTSPGRSGFGPQLSLSYDSGAGNGPFGWGWNMSIPAITRKTDKGLPKYRDADESDVFILSGAEDLVPVPDEDQPDGQRTVGGVDYHVRRYRPRIEGLFARIECWRDQATGEIHWRSISRDNITTLYGKTEESRIADPADPSRVFSWQICENYDDKGNAIVYEYAAENDENVDRARANERNRVRTANRYLKRIKYGNRVSRLIQPDLTQTEWMFEVVFDYDEGHYEDLDPDPAQPEAEQHRFVRASASPGDLWTVRPDPFSSHRAGFEVRTYRRCRRVLMFHRFDELGDEPYLVRSTEFEYADLDYSQPTTIEAELAHQGSTRFASFIRTATQSGCVRDDTQAVLERNGVNYVTYLKKSLPPLEFGYSKASIQDDIRELDASSLENLPAGLDGATYQWVDLDGEGVSGILTEQADVWFYKPNLGEGRFGPQETVAAKPSLASLSSGRQQLLDLAGDGQLDLAAFAGPTPGFFERTHDQDWEPFRAFAHLPNIPWDEPNLRFVDLNGDGHADVLITEHEIFTWHPSLAEEGFGPAEHARQPLDEERGPRLIFADGTESIYLADMCGDGLTDLVRLRNGGVCYWPNLGYGRFGAKVTMDNAPWFDNSDQFNRRRIRLADIDGSGTNDIIYLGRDSVRLYFNQSGNRWSEPRRLDQFPPVDNLSSVMTADLLGNGTACLIWSSSLSGDARRPMRYIDLMGGQKPHLLIKSVNNFGAETHVQYASSTKFYLADKLGGKPWITKLPFPVHVVERVETYDRVSRNRFVTRSAYHHGYFDGIEREFRGFGMVEQWDTEEFAALNANGDSPTADNIDAASHVPPVHTKTWFHTGGYLGRDHISDFFAGLTDGQQHPGEYYREPAWLDDDDEARKRLLDDTVLPPGLTTEEEREACRALKGSMLRQEVYALDGTGTEDYPSGHPYTVTEQNFAIRRVQPRAGNRHAVFFTHAREAINYHYERNPADPRIAHALTLEVDKFGNALRSLAIAYPRANVPERQPEQNETHLTLTLNRFANRDDQGDWYRVGLPVETRTYEVVKPPAATRRFTWKELSDLVAVLVPLNRHEPPLANTIPYEQWDWRKQWNPQSEPGGLVNGDSVNTRLRVIEHVRTLYRKDDLTDLLPLGSFESLALPGESYKLAFTPGLLAHVFMRKQTGQPDEDLLPDPGPLLEGKGDDQGGYVMMDGDWWIPSGRAFFDPAADTANPANTAALELSTARRHFYLPRKVADPFDQSTVVDYDGPADPDAPRYDLLVTRTSDAVDNTITALNDYRVLQPRLVTDPNRNRTEVAFDTLGMVAGTAVKGKDDSVGDTLTGFQPDLTQAQVDGFYDVADPRVPAPGLLQGATMHTIYDLDRFRRTRQAHPEDPTQWLPVYAATLARETHDSDALPPQGLKIQISFSYSDGFGREIQTKIQAEPGPLVEGGPLVSPRWVGGGWTVFNNKGKPVRQYEPFFSQLPEERHRFEFGVRAGVSPILFYDPVERVVATLHPNHTYEKVVFDPWRQTTHDVNDTIAAAATETGDPRADADIKGYTAEYFKTQPNTWQTWHQERITGAKGAQEKSAAEKAAKHANTPTAAHFDTLGRPFLTIAHNRFERNGATTEEKYPTRVELDIEGNQRAVIDVEERIVMRYDYDLLGNVIYQASMEAGERWMLTDVVGNPIRAWDSRRFIRRMTYDELRRPLGLFVSDNGAPEFLAEKTEYGESKPDPEASNHRGKVWKVYDGAGIVTSVLYDFKGNLREGRCDLLPGYKQAVNWLLNPAANDGSFTSTTTYDALNRPLTVTSPDGSVYQPTFNEANLLDKVDVNLRGEQENEQPKWTPFVTNINYNAKGQRELIAYANGAQTTYKYDPLTFRLTHLKTTRPSNPDAMVSQLFQNTTVVQDLRYTYDPAGNITRIEDAALMTVFHNQQTVEPVCSYVYDAVYRLIEASGREHIGQTAHDFDPPDGNRRDYPFVGHRAHPNDLQALRTYTEHYEYDAVGNFDVMRHIANGGSWTRRYDYEEDSLIEPGKQSNRLTRTTVGNGFNHIETYTYTDTQGNDVQGCMTAINSMKMVWDFEDQLQQVDLGGGGTAYYVYDAAGQRARKVLENQNGTRTEERLYLGGFEVYRKLAGANTGLVRETLHIMDDQQRIALVETRNDVNDGTAKQLIGYQFGNHLGSVSLELDDQAQISSYEEYTPYGSTSYQAGRSQTEAAKRYRYTGMERDEESGLAYHNARYYAPWLGRWTATDPAGLVDGPGLYSFSQNDPVNLRDVTGQEAKEGDLIEYSKGLGKGHKLEQLHFFPESLQKKINPGWTRPLSKRHKELVLVGSASLNRVDKKIAKYILDEGIDNIRDDKHLLKIIHRIEEIWVEAGVDRDKVRRWAKSSFSTAMKIGITKKPVPKAPSVQRRRGGVVSDALSKAGKVAKPLAILVGVVTVGEAAADVFRGDFRKAAGKIGSFAYDQTIGTAVDAVSTVKDVAEFLADPLAGLRESIDQMVKERDEQYEGLFGREEQQTPPTPSPFPAPTPPRPKPKPYRGTLEGSLMLWTVAIGLAAKGSSSVPEAEVPESEKIDLGEIDCDAVDLEELNDYIYSCAE